ncbi:Alpha-mannosidase 2C1 [Desmophyllum pertusum]|uniref:Alpha-mannosidase 2C1 n=1 Tax=Desmophyllum pertusum TaxID=174260 RepID=A0A9X0D665_9CNID|nr:Alpha-mannosidase 2C1 [Desmophyllum pertusum]
MKRLSLSVTHSVWILGGNSLSGLKSITRLCLTRSRCSPAKGQFIPVGGTWVEMDGNIPSGESFIRQFLVGQDFYQKEFGQVCQEFWLPDTFGYSAQLPQIITRSRNEFHTFFWEGIDGSRCLSHFPPADTYESRANAADVIKTVKQLKDKGKAHASMLLYGHGDGGGGPSEDMLEMLKRMEDVDGCPRVKLSTPQEFFHSLESRDADTLCTWVGELYLELHQGTYTTQGRIKQGNRQSEFLLHDAELMSTLACILGGKDPECYPADEFLRIWKLMLLNQFHDILPGSCIKQAADDALQSYQVLVSVPGVIITNLCETPTEAHPVSVSFHQSQGSFVLENAHVRAELVRGRPVDKSQGTRPTAREAISSGNSGNQFILFDDISVILGCPGMLCRTT